MRIITLIILILSYVLASILMASDPVAFQRPITPIPPADGNGYTVLTVKSIKQMQIDNKEIYSGQYAVISITDLEQLTDYIKELEAYNANANRLIAHFGEQEAPKKRKFFPIPGTYKTVKINGEPANERDATRNP